MEKELLEEFEANRSNLRSFILRLTTSVEDTEDIIQETYIKAHKNIDSFKGNSNLKTWIFSIASNLAKDHLRAKKRWPENVTDICREEALSNRDFLGEMMNIRISSDHGNFEIKEHISFCFTCVSKSLPLEQQLVIFLKEVYDFKIVEIAEIINNTQEMVKYYLNKSRNKMKNIFEGRCSLINNEGICHQCTELNGIFNPKQDKQEALVQISLYNDSNNPDKDHLLKLRTEIVKELDPYESGASELQLRHLKHNHEVMERFLESN